MGIASIRHNVYGSPVGIATYGVAVLASMGGFMFGWCVAHVRGCVDISGTPVRSPI